MYNNSIKAEHYVLGAEGNSQGRMPVHCRAHIHMTKRCVQFLSVCLCATGGIYMIWGRMQTLHTPLEWICDSNFQSCRCETTVLPTEPLYCPADNFTGESQTQNV